MRSLAVFLVAVLVVSAASSGVAVADGNGSAPKCGGGELRLNPEELKVFELHNEVRRQKGLKPFCVNPKLTRAARAHSRDMLRKDYFSHDSVDGRTFEDRIKAPGYTLKGHRYMKIGENLAWGSDHLSTPETAMRNWLESPGHRRNLLDDRFRAVGVGSRTGKYQGHEYATVYTVDFGGRYR